MEKTVFYIKSNLFFFSLKDSVWLGALDRDLNDLNASSSGLFSGFH